MSNEKNNEQVLTEKKPERLPDWWLLELIEQAKEDKQRAERFLFASVGFNVILAAVVAVLVLR